MTALEQELVNIASIVASTVGTAAAANNPAYASLIGVGQSFVESINASVNPSSAAAATQLSSDVAATIQPATTAVKQITSAAATATTKAAAGSTLLKSAGTIVADVEALFKLL